jgi:hypothetical protein
MQFAIEALPKGFQLLTILILAIKGRLKRILRSQSSSFKCSIRGTCLRLNGSNRAIFLILLD